MQYGGVVRNMLSAIVLAQKHVNISGGKEKKKNNKSKILFREEGEFRVNFSKAQTQVSSFGFTLKKENR